MPAKMFKRRNARQYYKRKYYKKGAVRFMNQNKPNGLMQEIKANNLLVKSQYCDFAMSFVREMKPQDVGFTTEVFSRFDFQGLVTNVWGINSPPLWARAAPLFEEYAVKGLTLEWLPSNQVAAVNTAPLLVTGFIYQDINTYNIGNYGDAQC